MNKKKAIKILNNQISKLDDFYSNDLYDMVWKVQTETYLKRFFGSESGQVAYFNKLRISFQKPDPTRFLNECIEIIENVGIYKEPKKNLLSSLPDSVIALILTTIGIASFSLGKYTSDTQNIELKRENKVLIDSLSFFKSSKISNEEKHYTKSFNTKKDSIPK